jgi:hypothetical protein
MQAHVLRLRNLAEQLQAAVRNPAPWRHGPPQHVAAAAAAAAAAFNDLGPDPAPDDVSECSESDSQGGYSEAEDDVWEQQAGASAYPATAAGTAAGDPAAPDGGPLPQQSGVEQVGALCPLVYLCADQGGCRHALHPLPTVSAMMEGNQTHPSPCQPTGMFSWIRCGSLCHACLSLHIQLALRHHPSSQVLRCCPCRHMFRFGVITNHGQQHRMPSNCCKA